MAAYLGYKLKSAREKLGFTQAQLANRINVSPSAIGMYEQGRRSPDYQTLINLCTELNLSVNDIWGLYIENDVDSVDIDVVLKSVINYIKSRDNNICSKGKKLGKQNINNIVYVLELILKDNF